MNGNGLSIIKRDGSKENLNLDEIEFENLLNKSNQKLDFIFFLNVKKNWIILKKIR